MRSSSGSRPRSRWPLTGLLAAGCLLLAGCSAGQQQGPTAVQSRQPATRAVPAVRLGTTEQVLAASSFGPGRDDVPITVAVLAFTDHVVASDKAIPADPASHWASARVRVCRSRPVIFGYPAWVLGDDAGRTAQTAKVQHPGFPRPAFPDVSVTAGCAQGWVTWSTMNALHATKVTFEQTREVPGAWRLR